MLRQGEEPAAHLSSGATRAVYGEPKATDPLGTEGPSPGLAGSQPHTRLSVTTTKDVTSREMPSGAKWTAVPRSTLPVTVGVNVAHYHQLGGRGPHLPSVQRDHRPTSNSSPYGPPEPLCLCLWNSRNKTAYGNQLRAAHLPSQLQQKPSEREKAPGPKPLVEFPFTHVTAPLPPASPETPVQQVSTGLRESQHEDNMFNAVISNKKQFCLSLFQGCHCSRAVHTVAAL